MRLTKKTKELKNEICYLMPIDNELKALDKLGQLEDIEDELGIDLITLFKALKNGIYVKEEHLPKSPIRFIVPDELVFDTEYLYQLKFCRAYTKLRETCYPFYFKDYGKTWALTKEELL